MKGLKTPIICKYNSHVYYYYANLDINGDLIWLDGPDEGEGDGVWQPGDTWNDNNGNWEVDENEAGWDFGGYFNFLQHTPGVDDDLDGIIDECYPGFWGENFQGDVGWNFLALSEMEISGGGYVMNCYGICTDYVGELSDYVMEEVV